MKTSCSLLLGVALSACGQSNPPPGAAPAVASAGASATPAMAPAQKAKIVDAPAAAAGSQPSDGSAAGSQPSGSHAAGSQPVGDLPPGHPPLGGGAAPANGADVSISGKIALAPEVAASVKAGSTLFIMVRRDAGEGQRGMMLAAKKVPVTGSEMFPLDYTVTGADMMLAGTALEGAVRVEARVDQDGDAISKAPGDVVGRAPQPITVGAPGAVDLTLAEKL